MAGEDLTSLLDAAGARYELLPHAHTETAADEAKALGIAADEVAKTLVLTAPDGHVRAVLPASARIDIRKVSTLLGAGRKKVHLATEADLARDYPDFELGAVPPLGGRRDPVIVDSRLAEQESVVLEAGSHEQSVRMQTADLLRLSEAQVADISQEGK